MGVAEQQWRMAALKATCDIAITGESCTYTLDCAAADAAVVFITEKFIRPVVNAYDALPEQLQDPTLQRALEDIDASFSSPPVAVREAGQA